MDGLGTERDPNDVATLGYIRSCPLHQTSLPTAGPVSHSPCRLSSVMPRNNSSSDGGAGGSDRTTMEPFTSESSTGAFSHKPASTANDLGMRRARLLPHFRTRVFMSASSYLR